MILGSQSVIVAPLLFRQDVFAQYPVYKTLTGKLRVRNLGVSLLCCPSILSSYDRMNEIIEDPVNPVKRIRRRRVLFKIA